MCQVGHVDAGWIGRRDGRDGHAHEPQIRRMGLQVIGIVISNMGRTTGLVIKTVCHVHDCRAVIINTSSNQISFGGLLLGVFGLLGVVSAIAATSVGI